MWRHCKPCQVYWKENTVKCWCCETPTTVDRGPGITANKYVGLHEDNIDPLDERYPSMITRVLS